MKNHANNNWCDGAFYAAQADSGKAISGTDAVLFCKLKSKLGKMHVFKCCFLDAVVFLLQYSPLQSISATQFCIFLFCSFSYI